MTKLLISAPAAETTSQTVSPNSKQAVIVLAMHRTGSSALTRALNLLGCSVAKTLIAGNQHNERGYWESDVLRVFNDKVLDSAGSDWRDWHAINKNWYSSTAFAGFIERGSKLLQDEFADSRFFALKDPRISRIFPFWKELLNKNEIIPKVILTLRHPASVSRSLYSRDKISSPEAALIWLRNNLEAEYSSRGLNRCVIEYDKLLVAPVDTLLAVQSPLDLTWPRFSPKVREEIENFLTKELRHHEATSYAATEKRPFSIFTEVVYSIFERWSREGENQSDYEALDAIRVELDRLAEPLHDVISVVREYAEIDKQRSDKLFSLEEENSSLVQLVSERDQLIEKNGSLMSMISERDLSIERLSDQVTSLTQQALNDAKSSQDELILCKDMISERDRALEAVGAQLSNLRQDAQEAAKISAELVADLNERISQYEAKIAELMQLQDQQEAELSGARQSIVSLERKHDDLQHRLQKQEKDTAAVSVLLYNAEKSLEVSEAEVKRYAKQLESLQHEKQKQLSVLQSELQESNLRNQAAHERVQELLASTSWRVTGPLRRLSTIVRR